MKPERDDRTAAPARLRDAWWRRSLAGGWLTPDDWHSEAVDAVLTACQPGRPTGGGLAVACTGLGRSRATGPARPSHWSPRAGISPSGTPGCAGACRPRSAPRSA
jgi:hypothetical protein